MKDDLGYALDILEYARRLQRHTSGQTLANFLAREQLQDAAFRCLEIMGEATKRLSPEFRAAHPKINWSGMAGFRDVLVHGYDGLDHELCWKIISESVPVVIVELEKIIPPES